MGRVKQLMMEMEEHDYTGFSKGEKYVCTHHFDDKYLNQYIQENSEDCICSYCHKKGRVIDMSALADHIGMTISIFFNDVDSEGLPLASSYYDDDKEEIPGIKRVGCFAVPEKTEVYEDTSEMMEDLGLHTECEELNEDMDHLFEDNMWIKTDPFDLKKTKDPDFSLSVFIRMLYSCLVDADFLDTERFMKNGSVDRDKGESMDMLLGRLEKHISEWLKNPDIDTEIYRDKRKRKKLELK